ncbi:DNA primase [Fimbriimonas ginsengisoli]|uniref:DNA primase n=1 Tax=Fimbriimonas ginsengisoli Gsoil 348 TaxID=661478 RepID=A0A068NYD4_FIMGI|nr:DNA primase [Fimbriimonas ginsengisoli]AIE86874.1 DNA primase [Fimbriimonas ginsengisoli Gsoil 348]
MADERDEIRSRVDIVDLVSREVPLKQRGRHWTGLCPFHADKNPSFNVSPETGRFKCWSCQATGDIFDWVMRRQNVDFAEAIQILAKEAGITLKRGGGMPASTRQQYETAMDAGLAFFRENFVKSTTAQEYCAGRGLDAATLDLWEIGYAPDVGVALPNHLKKAGVSLAEAKTLFLVDGDQDTGYYGKFRSRLMFPIRDEKGTLVAFGGRILGDGHPKYINSSDTPLYRKSRVLYGMHRAREQMGRERRAVLVEGYLDVIACHRAGVATAVASLGTALAEDQAKLLKRWCDEVVILYDSDEAGQKAAARAVEILEAEKLRVRVALMPLGEDPDTLLRNAGPAAVQTAVTRGLSPTDYRMQALERRLTPDKDEFWSEAVTILSETTSEIEMTAHIDRLSPLLPGTRDSNLAKQTLLRMITRTRRKAKGGGNQGPERPTVQRENRVILGELKAAEIVVFRAFLSEELRKNGWMFARATNLFESGIAQRLSEAILAAFPLEPPTGKPAEWLAKLEDEGIRSALADLLYEWRGDALNGQVFEDSIIKLQKAMAQREFRRLRAAGLSWEEVSERIRELNPDPTDKPKDGDDLF